MDQGGSDTANTISNSFVSGVAVQIGSVTGTLTLAVDRPDYQVHWLAPVVTRPTFLPERHRTPSRLLDARREVVPYRDRPAVQKRLLAWLGSKAPSSVLLLHGAGGRGKTRLANAFAGHAHLSGWRVAHAVNRTTDRHAMVPASSPLAASPTGSTECAGVLVAVDYAERWSDVGLKTLISDLTREHAQVTLRVLLLARSVQDVWQPLQDHLDLTPVDLPDPIELLDLTDSAAARAEAFLDAAQAFHAKLALPEPCTATPPPDLGHDDYASPLVLHMAALAAVCAGHDHDTIPHRDDLSSYLLAHERRLWPPHPRGADAVLLATLFGPLDSEDDALALLEASGVTDGVAAGRELLSWHDRVYPESQELPPLMPDRFGEDFVADHLGTHPRAARLVVRAAQSTPVLRKVSRRPAAVLVATAARHAAVRDVLWKILPESPSLSFAPGPELVRLAIEHAPFDVQALVVDQLPHPDIGMRQPGLELTGALAKNLSDDLPAKTRAAVLMNLAMRLKNSGQDPAALTGLVERATSIMVDAWRKSPDDRDLALRTAQVLMNGKSHTAGHGDLPGALRGLDESIGILRGIKGAEDAERDITLVSALLNKAVVLSRSGRPDEAAAAETEAMDLAERVTGPSPMRPSLADAATRLARRYAANSQQLQAVRAARIAALHYRDLAGVSPEYYGKAAVVSLNEYGTYQAAAGHPDSALQNVLTAIGLARTHLDDDIADFAPVLAQLLHNAAEITLLTSADDRTARAHAHATEAVERYRSLLPTHPDLAGRWKEVLALVRRIDEQDDRTAQGPTTGEARSAPS
ncbi:hypothetical protein [Lentzea sp. NPDC059081]|uniref:hypothetical protein n=1 Tax=Lentzea sp. NPDC059081 TaxID=3346719 RepID=UPI00368E7789